ncbi:hypothetical protein V2G26_012554 [Clonostachys chloroleuca]
MDFLIDGRGTGEELSLQLQGDHYTLLCNNIAYLSQTQPQTQPRTQPRMSITFNEHGNKKDNRSSKDRSQDRASQVANTLGDGTADLFRSSYVLEGFMSLMNNIPPQEAKESLDQQKEKRL